MPNIIGFFGSYPADICIYAAYALQNAGRRVCVIDNSRDGILFQCVPTPNQRFTSVTYRNVDFMRRQPWMQWNELHYDYIFVQMGDRPEELCLALCTERILIVDCERRNLDFYQQFIQQSSLPVTILLRGFCSGQLTAEKLKNHFAGGPFINRWLMLPLDEADEVYRIEMQYGPLCQFAHISTGMERVLMQLLRMMEIHDRIQAVRAVRDAKQGKAAHIVMQFDSKNRRIVSVENCVLE